MWSPRGGSAEARSPESRHKCRRCNGRAESDYAGTLLPGRWVGRPYQAPARCLQPTWRGHLADGFSSLTTRFRRTLSLTWPLSGRLVMGTPPSRSDLAGSRLDDHHRHDDTSTRLRPAKALTFPPSGPQAWTIVAAKSAADRVSPWSPPKAAPRSPSPPGRLVNSGSEIMSFRENRVQRASIRLIIHIVSLPAAGRCDR